VRVFCVCVCVCVCDVMFDNEASGACVVAREGNVLVSFQLHAVGPRLQLAVLSRDS
jgi:hypothetical protein